MSKYSPSPWSVLPALDNTLDFAVVDARGMGIAVDISQGNAALIAAAPEMLEALRELSEPQNREFLTPRCALIIDLAIAKAEGKV